MARHHAKARGQRVVELELMPASGKGIHVVEQRQVVQDGVVGRDRHVVRQARSGQLHWHESLELTQPVHHAIVHVGRFFAIGKKQELAGAFVDPRVGRDRQARQARVDRQPAHGGQVARAALVDRAAQVPHRHQVPGVVLDVGVGGVLYRHVRPVLARRVLDALPQCRAGAELFLQAVGHDPAVLVLGFAVGKAHRMQHAVAVKPVVAAGRLEAAVGAVAHVHACQVFRNFALDVSQVERQLVVDRRKAAIQDRDLVVAHGLFLQCESTGVSARAGRRDWVTQKRLATKARCVRAALPAGFRPVTW